MHGRIGTSYFSVRASVTDDGNGNHHIVIVIKKWARLSPFAEAGADTCFLKARNGTCGFCLLLGISEGRQLIVSLASNNFVIFVLSLGLIGLSFSISLSLNCCIGNDLGLIGRNLCFCQLLLSLKIVIFDPRFSRGLKGLQLADVTR